MPKLFSGKKLLTLNEESVMLRMPPDRLQKTLYDITCSPKSTQLSFNIPPASSYKNESDKEKKNNLLASLEGKLEKFRRALCYLNKEHCCGVTLYDIESIMNRVKSHLNNLGFPVIGKQVRCSPAAQSQQFGRGSVC